MGPVGDMGPGWLWAIIGILAAIGFVAGIVWIVKGIIWLINHTQFI